MHSFGSGPPAALLDEALRALLAPVVLLAAIAGLLLGLQRDYVGLVTTMRALNVRRRQGQAGARREFFLVYEQAILQARTIALLYGACVMLLVSACTTGAVLLMEAETASRLSPLLLATMTRLGLACFVAGIVLPMYALVLLLRGVALPLRAVTES